MKKKLTYRQAGVDIQATDSAIEKVKRLVSTSQGPEVLRGIGAFGGLFQPVLTGVSEPVLVSSADGVGTKVMIAEAAGQYKGLGHDLVNHCVNDIGVMGARPLFFLDYLAFGKFREQVALDLIAGFVEACAANHCALLGGETAEMPDLYAENDFDVAGFIVGMVDKSRIIDGHTIGPADCLVGIASNGLHTNGYSLVRKIFFDKNYRRLADMVTGENETLGQVLLRSHLSYLPLIESLSPTTVKGLAHITGGGIAGNLVRILPQGTAAKIAWGSWPVPPIFDYIQKNGDISLSEMRTVFNMGVGLIIACGPEHLSETLGHVASKGYHGHMIGTIVPGNAEVLFE